MKLFRQPFEIYPRRPWIGTSAVTGPQAYTDSGTARLSFTPSSAEKIAATDAATVNFKFKSRFPLTSILDNFNRTDEAPPTGWAGPIRPGSFGLAVRSNALGSAGDYANGYYNTVIDKDGEMFATIVALPAPDALGFWFLLRLANPNTASNCGYEVSYTLSTQTMAIYRRDNDTAVYIDNRVCPINIGDQLGFRIVKDRIEVYLNGAHVFGWRGDTTYNNDGYMGIHADRMTMKFDDFGGGSLAGLDIYGERRVVTDTGTARLSFTPSGTEKAVFVDTGTRLLDLQPSGTEKAVFVDTGTRLLDLQPSGSETTVFADSGSVRLGLTAFPLVFTDDFEDGTIDPPWANPPAGLTEASGYLEVTTPGQYNLYSRQSFAVDMGMVLELEVDIAGTPHTGQYYWLGVYLAGGDIGIAVEWDEGTSNYITWNGPLENNLFDITGITPKYVRMAYIEGGTYGTLVWSYSVDGSSWIEIARQVSNRLFAPSTARINFDRDAADFSIHLKDLKFYAGIEHRIISDSGTAQLSLTPSSSEQRISTDSDTGLLDLQPSGSDTYVTGGTIYTDSGTTLLDLQASGSEARISTDSGTDLLDLQPSGTEVAVFVDSGTKSLAFTPSATEQRVSTDSATESFDLQPSGSEKAIFVDSGTDLLDLQPSGTEARVVTDGATETLDLQPSGSEKAVFVDAAGSNLYLIPSATEFRTVFDTASTYLDLQSSGSDTGQYTDSATESLDLQADGAEQRISSDTDSALLDLQPSGTEQQVIGGQVYTDSGTETLALSASGSERAAFADSGLERIALPPSGSDRAVYADAGTESLALTASGSEVAAVVDAQTERLSLTASGSEARTIFDSGSGYLDLQASGTDRAVYVDSGSTDCDLQPSGSELHTISDSTSEYFDLQPSGTDRQTQVDSGTEPLALSVSGSEKAVYADANTERVALLATGNDTAAFVDSATESFTLTVSGTDVQTSGYNDAATGYLDLDPSGTDTLLYVYTEAGEVYVLFTFTGTEYIAQVFHPVSDVATGGWTNELGEATNLYASIDELTPDSADYIQSSQSPSTDDISIIRLAGGLKPVSRTGHSLRMQYQKDQSGGDNIDLSVSLLRADATTVVKSVAYTAIDAVTDVIIELSEAEANTIPDADYATGLCVKFDAIH